MPDRVRFSDDITIAAQPSEAAFEAMASDGVKTVINLRHDGEDMQPLSPDAERAVVEAKGMAYIHEPVSMKDADASTVDRFRKVLAEADKPVLVHCKLGQRAGAMVMMDHAVRQGWTGDETLTKAKEMGFACDNEKLAAFVREYVDSRKVEPQMNAEDRG